MVRVLYILSWGLHLGGGETTIMNYYRNIDRTKVQFDFLITDDGDDKHYYEDEARSLGANLYRRPSVKKSLVKYIFSLRNILKENPEIKIIHIHDAVPLNPAMDAFCAKLAGISVRIIYSGSDVRTLKIKHQKFFQPIARALATHCFAGSVEAGVSMFGEKARNKITILPRARELEKFRYNSNQRSIIREKMSIGNNTVIIHVGRLFTVKNHMFLLEAFAQALEKNPRLLLLLAGTGELMPELVEMAERLQLGESIRFLGQRNDIHDLLQAADIFVLPSVHEGFPGAAIEAQAAGLPCLLSDTITSAIKVTSPVEFLPIDKGSKIWAERMSAYQGFKRCDTIEEVRQAGYDIKDAARWLEKLYIDALIGFDDYK